MGKHRNVYRHKHGSILCRFIATLTLVVLCAPLANADEIRVLSGGAAKALVEPLAQSFKVAYGHVALVEFQPMGPLTERLAKGEAIDMVILTSDVLERLEREGKLPKCIDRPIARA